ncbi:MAG: polyketide synthase [Myxococcales bacterium]|nr:polyketide synthase [Myxococcales bacterium]
MSEEPIAVVGMACRFPGADGLSGYWELLEHGRSAIGPVPEERLHALPVEEHPGMRVGGFLESVYDFDWSAFRIGPREAKWMDPQHRLLLEVAWEALEDGGIPVDSLDEQCTGVFIGSSWNDYHRLHSGDLEAVQGHLASGVPPAFAANRISHCFDARGPSFTVDASCASALAALHQACQALRTGACERVVVGAASLMLAPDNFVMLARAGLLSRHGRVMALDRDADGFVRGDGVRGREGGGGRGADTQAAATCVGPRPCVLLDSGMRAQSCWADAVDHGAKRQSTGAGTSGGPRSGWP